MSDKVTPPAGDASGSPAEGATPPAATNTGDGSLNAKLKLLEKQFGQVQKENANLKKAEEDRKTSELSDLDRLKQKETQLTGQVENLQKTINTQAKQFAFKVAATKAGCVNPDAACRLADLATLQLDESGGVVGTDEYLEVFKGQHTYFFGQETTSPTPTASSGGNPTSGAPKPPSPAALAKMSREQRSEYFKQAEGRQFF
jgi:phosphopantetheinyl transferase (holo-ACP synthase)